MFFRGKSFKNAYIRKKERFKINDLRFHLKKLEKEEQLASKKCRKRKVKR